MSRTPTPFSDTTSTSSSLGMAGLSMTGVTKTVTAVFMNKRLMHCTPGASLLMALVKYHMEFVTLAGAPQSCNVWGHVGGGDPEKQKDKKTA